MLAFLFSPFMEVIRNYSSSSYSAKDFACRCGCGFDKLDNKLLFLLDKITEAFRRPLVITSGCRCRKYNAEIGGAPGSRHLTGMAVDIACTDSTKRYDLVKLAMEFGITGIGVGKSFLHLDIREGFCFWTY